MFSVLKKLLKPQGAEKSDIVRGRYYERSGDCNLCGKCCTNIYLVHEEQVIQNESMFRALQARHSEYQSFIPVEQTDDGLVFQCSNLQADNSCADYDNRPDFCRKYPTEHTLLLGGKLSEECSYSFRLIKTFQSVLSDTYAEKVAR